MKYINSKLDSLLINNNAHDGGSLALWDSDLSVFGLNCSESFAKSGGCLFMKGVSLNVSKSFFTMNRVSSNGAAIFVDEDHLTTSFTIESEH